MIGQTLFNALVVGRMRSAPLQSLVIVAVLVLGVVAGMTLGLVDAAVRDSIALDVTRLTAGVNLQITAPGGTVPEGLLRRVRALPGLRLAQPVLTGTARIETAGGARILRLEGVDLFALAGDQAFRAGLLPGLYADRGALIAPAALLDDNAIVVSPALLAALHVPLGAAMEARVQGHPVRLLLAAAAPPSLGLTDPNVALIDIASAQALFAAPGRIDRIDISVPPDREAATAAVLARIVPSGLRIERPANRLAALGRSVAGVRGALAVLGVVIALLAAAVVLNTAGSAVVQRTREIAILRALGVRRRSLEIVFLIEGLLYGVGGSFLGMMIGGLAAPGIVRAAAGTVAGTPVLVAPALAIGFVDQLRIFAIIATLATVAVLLPARETIRSPRATRTGLRWLWGRRALSAGVGLFAAALIFRVLTPPEAALSASVPALLVLAGSCLCIAPAIGALASALLNLRALPRPQAWLAATFVREPAPAAIVGMATLVVAVALLAGAAIVERSERVAAVELARAAYPGDLVVRDPQGVLRGRLAPEQLARDLIRSAARRPGTGDTVLVRRADVPESALLAALVPAASARGVRIESTNQLLRAATAPIDAIFALLRVALLLAFAIALAGVASGAFSAVLDRRDQIATLRSVGASRRHIVRMVFAESIVRAIAGCALGALAAFALAAIALTRTRLAVPVPDVLLVLAAGATAAVAAALPGSYAAGRIRADRGMDR